MATSINSEKMAEAEDAFRGSLEDVIAIAEGLSKHCKNLTELVGMSKLALENDGQLRLIMDIITQPKK